MGLFVGGNRCFLGNEESRGMMLSERIRIWNIILKLRVLDFHFYHQSGFDWQVEVGDMYCLSRFGLQLMVVRRVSNLNRELLPTKESVVYARTLIEDTGDYSPKSARDLEFPYEQFVSGGFASSRLVIPEFIWQRALAEWTHDRFAPMLKADNLATAPEVYRTSSGEPWSDEEAKAFDALAAGDSVPQLGTPWPPGPPTGIEYSEKQIGGHAIAPVDWAAIDPAKKKEEEEKKGGEQLWLPGQ